MRNLTIMWFLGGALTASAALNVYSARRTERVPPSPVTSCACQVESNKRTCDLIDKVGLTQEQKKRFSACCPKKDKRCIKFKKRLASLSSKLETVLCGNSPTMKDIQAIADEIGQLRAEEIKSRARRILLVRETLTNDQLERLVRCCGRD